MPMRILQSRSGQAGGLLVLGVFFEAFQMLRVTGGVTLGDALILASGVLVFVDAVQGRARIWMPMWVLLAFPLVIGGTAIDALFIGRQHHDDVVLGVEFLYCALVLPAVIASQSPDRQLAWRLVLAWLVGNILGAVIAYLQFHRYDLGPLNHLLMRNGDRVAGLNPNANTLGATLAMVTPMCLAFAVDARRPLPMALWGAALMLCLHVIDLTGSRTSLVAVSLGCMAVAVLFGARLQRGELPLRLAQVTAALLLAAAAWQLRSGFHDSAIERLLGHSPTAELSAWFREGLNRASLEAFRESPFLGYGYAHMKAHNVPLAVVQGGGLAGIAGFVLVQAGLLIGALRLYAQSRSDLSIRGFAIGVLGAWCSWLALGTYDVSILNRNAYIAFGLAVLWRVSGQAATESSPAVPALAARGAAR